MSEGLPDYGDENLARKVEALTQAQIDGLPFGAIRIDAAGSVAAYSEAERRLSGSGTLPRVGLDFFTEIAPCMGGDAYRGRIERAIERGTLDLEFTHIGDFDDRERELTVRVQSASGGGYWIFMQRS
jgi:photoactive yellow protein